MADFFQLPQNIQVGVKETDIQQRTAVVDDLTKLYPDRDTGTNFNTIISLLSELNRSFQSAKRYLDEGDLLEADTEVMNAWALLPELFCLRYSSSDGFSSLITVLFNSIKNQEGMPLNSTQLDEVAYVVRRLNAAPMMNFEMAFPLIKSMRDSGLNIESSEMQSLFGGFE